MSRILIAVAIFVSAAMLEMGGAIILGRVPQVGTMMMRMAAMGGRGERGGRPYPSKKKFL